MMTLLPPILRAAPLAASLAALLLSLAAPALAQSPGPSRSQGSSTAQGVDARFGLVQAIETAEREGKGRATAAEFTPFPQGGGALEVTLMRGDASVAKVRVDANTGAVVNVTEQTVEGYLTRLDPGALNAQKLTMGQAIAAAEARVQGGIAIGAEVKRDGDALTTEVSVLKDGATTNFIVAEDGTVSDG